MQFKDYEINKIECLMEHFQAALLFEHFHTVI